MATDITGQRFNRFTVIANVRGSRWLCRCDCGNKRTVEAHKLRNGDTKSCGCYRQERASAAARTHGEGAPGRQTVEYVTWCSMIGRCTNPSSDKFADYGGRGIKVCDRWRGTDGFSNFLADVGRRPGASYSLDRRDNDGDYEPSNVRWATQNQQQRNKRSSKLSNESVARIRELAASGVKQREIADRFGVGQAHISRVVLRKQWATQEAA